MQLSEHFTDEELRVAYQDPRIIANYRYICERLLEPIRNQYLEPVFITSGFRNVEHNVAAGGKPSSWHLAEGGRAAVDFFVNSISVVTVFDWIRLISGLPFDKVILEKKYGVPVIVHLQYDRFTKPERRAFIGGTGDSHNYEEVKVV